MLNGYKTIIFALITTVLGALETFNWTDFVSDSNSGVIIAVIGGVMAVLRYITKSPIFNK